MYKFGPVQKKILLTLTGGVAFGLSSSPSQYYRTLKKINKEWKKLNQQNFNRSVKKLSAEKLVEEKELSDGTIKLVLTENGKMQARRLSLLGNQIKFQKPKNWDGKWRIVMFDIPEKDRLFRDILREHLYNLKFVKFQKSAFISPFPFEKQILELVEIYSAQPYVRVITASEVDNNEEIKNKFKLINH